MTNYAFAAGAAKAPGTAPRRQIEYLLIVSVGVLIFTLIALMNQSGVETTSLIALLGATGLANGLTLQGTQSNVAAKGDVYGESPTNRKPPAPDPYLPAPSSWPVRRRSGRTSQHRRAAVQLLHHLGVGSIALTSRAKPRPHPTRTVRA